MSNEIQKTSNAIASFDNEQIELIKNTVCKGASDGELKLFLYACVRTGLDPFMKQIYSVPRGGQRTIQTSIDGYRLIAERTGHYAPGRESTYTYDANGRLFSATSYVKKQTNDGVWHEIGASALMSEFDGGANLWKKMPHVMLSKCAESQALRRAFPADMSGLYTEEEMTTSDNVEVADKKPKPIISSEQAFELAELYESCESECKDKITAFLKMNKVSQNFEGLRLSLYTSLKAKMIECQSKADLHSKSDTITLTDAGVSE